MSGKINKLNATIFAVSLFLVGTPSSAQSSHYKDVMDWSINQFSNSESSPTPSCSAVYFKDRMQALRVERFADGYFFGINGYSRDGYDVETGMSFWFDNDKSTELGGVPTFVKDVAYPHDDWLSFFLPIEEREMLIGAIANKSTMSYAVLIPGNRTGNDIVEINYELVGSAAAMSALDECYQTASGTQPPNLEQSTSATSDCPDDGPRLPESGICQGRGVNYLEITDDEQPPLDQNCSWKLNETALPGGDFLLYLATACGQHLSKLEFAGGARFAELTLTKSALADGQPAGKFITIATIDENDPKGSILAHAQSVMSDQTAAQQCFVTEINEAWYPADALSVTNRTPEQRQLAAQDGPLEPVCGPFGDPGDSTSYWRISNGYAWFFELGQDAYYDIDPRSLTFVSADDLSN